MGAKGREDVSDPFTQLFPEQFGNHPRARVRPGNVRRQYQHPLPSAEVAEDRFKSCPDLIPVKAPVTVSFRIVYHVIPFFCLLPLLRVVPLLHLPFAGLRFVRSFTLPWRHLRQ